jgi:hypothetical protein
VPPIGKELNDSHSVTNLPLRTSYDYKVISIAGVPSASLLADGKERE